MTMAGRPDPGETASRRRALLEAVQAFYAARHAGEIEEFASYFAPDARLTVVGNPVLNPGSGMRIGRDGIARYLLGLHEQNIYLGFRIHHVIADGDQVVVRWHVELRLQSNGRIGRFEALDHLVIRNSQIVELTQFYDTGLMALLQGRIKLA